MPDVIEEFFDRLDRYGHQRLLRKTTGTIRFDIDREDEIDHWFVAINHGDIHVSREECGADTVIRTDVIFFERLIRGQAKPLSAWLRNDITSEGHFRFIVLLERLFGEPAGAHNPRIVSHGHWGQR